MKKHEAFKENYMKIPSDYADGIFTEKQLSFEDLKHLAVMLSSLTPRTLNVRVIPSRIIQKGICLIQLNENDYKEFSKIISNENNQNPKRNIKV